MGLVSDFAAEEGWDYFDYYNTYYDLWAVKDGGRLSVQVMIEALPLTLPDGKLLRDPAEYMDYLSISLPETYASIGLETENPERSSRTLEGMDFECYSFSSYGAAMTQFMMSTEKNGVFLTIYVTTIGGDQTEYVLSLFSAC